jgi:hypothetical protein
VTRLGRARGFATGRGAWSPALIVLGLLYPWYVEPLQSLPLIGDFIPSTESMVVMVAFTMMASAQHRRRLRGPARPRLRRLLRRRRVHGGWFASQQFDQVTFHFRSSVRDASRDPHHDVARLSIGRLLTLLAGILIGLPTLRLRGDYLGDRDARLRRDRAAVRAQRRQRLRLRL